MAWTSIFIVHNEYYKCIQKSFVYLLVFKGRMLEEVFTSYASQCAAKKHC